MNRFCLFLLLFGLLLLICIPVVWWIGGAVGPPYSLPPLSPDWLKCLPSGLGKTQYWSSCLTTASANGFRVGLDVSLKVFIFAILNMTAALVILYLEEPPLSLVMRGRRLFKGSEAISVLKKALKKENNLGPIQIVKGVSVPKPYETRHWLIFGAVGAGKTVFLRWMIGQFIAAKQRNLLLDVKGDFIQDVCWTNNNGHLQTAIILNPFDKRSAQWWLGADIINVETAREFVKKFLSESISDPFWSKATGNLAVAAIRSLQVEKGRDWSWCDLADRTCAPIDQLRRWSELYYQPAVRVLESSGTEAAQSILINFSTDLALIGDIAAYWHRENKAQKISLRRWLWHKDPHEILILGWDASKESASKSWAGAFVDLAGMAIASPQFQNVGRTNFVLDEFAQLPKMTGILQALDVGRSKGVSVLIGAQSFYQLLNIYGQRAESFRSLIGNHVFAQMAAGKDAEDASRFLGNQVVREKQVSFAKGDQHSSTNTSWQEKERPLMTASEFGSCLGPDERGVKVVYTAIGHDAYILHYPFPQVKPLRAAFEAAIPVHEPMEIEGQKRREKFIPGKANPFKEILSTDKR